MADNPIKQGIAKQEVGYKRPPANRQFGQPDGNPRSTGAWKKENTARYKLEQMMQLKESDLIAIVTNESLPYFDRKIAKSINEGDWKVLESMINQVYGAPKQHLEVEPVQPKPLIDLTQEGKK